MARHLCDEVNNFLTNHEYESVYIFADQNTKEAIMIHRDYADASSVISGMAEYEGEDMCGTILFIIYCPFCGLKLIKE